MNSLKAKWYNTGYDEGKAGIKRRKLPYYLQGYYNQGYDQGKKLHKPKVSFWHKICLIGIVLFVALIVYYCNLYLCADSPVVPLRCKALPWEE
jgi:hypothetical protein